MKDFENRRKLDEALMRAGARPRFGTIQPEPEPQPDPFLSGPGMFAPRRAPEPSFDTMGYLRWRGEGGDHAAVNPFADLASDEPPPPLDMGPVGGPLSTAQNEPASAPGAPEFDVESAWDESGANHFLPRTGLAAFVPESAAEPRLDLNAYIRARAGLDRDTGTLTGATGLDGLRGGAGADDLEPVTDTFDWNYQPSLSRFDSGPPAPYRPASPAPRFGDLQGLEDDFFAGRYADERSAERELDRATMPFGLGQVTAPLVEPWFDPDKRASMARAAEGVGEWIMDRGEDALDYFGSGEAGRDVESAFDAAPRVASQIPQQAGRVAQDTSNAFDRGLDLAGSVFNTYADGFDPQRAAVETLALPERIRGRVGEAAVEYGPDILRGMTYGPGEDYEAHTREMDRARFRGDEEGVRDFADAANLDSVFHGLNVAFAPGDVAALGSFAARNLGRGAGEAASDFVRAAPIGEDIGQGYRLYDLPDGSVSVRNGERGQDMRFSDRRMADDLLPDIMAGDSPEVIQARRGEDYIDITPEEFGDEVPVVEPGGVDVFGQGPLRALRTPEEQGAWAEDALVHIAPDQADQRGAHVYGFRGPQDGEFALTVKTAPAAPGRGWIDLEDLNRDDTYSPFQRQNRFSADDAQRILERAAAAVSEDARTRGLAAYEIFSADPVQARAYRMASRNIALPPGYALEVDGETLRLVRQPDAPAPTGPRARDAEPSATTSEAIQRMPLLEAGAPIAGGALGATAAASFSDNAEASDGDIFNTLPEDLILPVLGAGAGVAGARALFGRGGREFVRELDNSAGMGARPGQRTRPVRDDIHDIIRLIHDEGMTLGDATMQVRGPGRVTAIEQTLRNMIARGEIEPIDEAILTSRSTERRGLPGFRGEYNEADLVNEALTRDQNGRLPSIDQIAMNLRDDVSDADHNAINQQFYRAINAARAAADQGEEAVTALAQRWNVTPERLREFAAIKGERRGFSAAREAREIVASGVTEPQEIIAELRRRADAVGAEGANLKVHASNARRAAGLTGNGAPTAPLIENINSPVPPRTKGGQGANAALLATGLGAGALALGDEAEAEDMSAEDALGAYGQEEDYARWQAVQPRGRVSSNLERIGIDEENPGGAYYRDRVTGRVYYGQVSRDDTGEGDPLSINIISELVPPQGRASGDAAPEWDDPFDYGPVISAGMGTLAGVLARRPVVGAALGGLTAGAMDVATGGEDPYFPALTAMIAAPTLRYAHDLGGDTLRALSQDGRARIASYAETLPETASQIRGLRVENDALFGPRAYLPYGGEGITVPRLDQAYSVRTRIPTDESIEQGYSRPLGEGPSQRDWFLSMPPAEQLRLANSATARTARIEDNLAAYLESRRPPELPPSGGDPMLSGPPRASSEAAANVGDPMQSMPPDIDLTDRRRFRVTPEQMVEDPEGRARLLMDRLRTRPAAEVARQLAQNFGVEEGANASQTAANILRAAKSNPALYDTLRRLGALSIIGAVAGVSTEADAPVN